MRNDLRTLTLCAVLVACCAPAPAQQAASGSHSFALKEDQPRLGSLLRHEMATGSHVPYDKSYDELTPEQQAVIKSQYETMGPGDEPPYPSHGLLPIVKALWKAQQKLQVEGELTLAVDVGPGGEPLSVAVYQPSNEDMARFAAKVLMLQSYRPARCGGQPCQQQFPFRLSFSLRDE